MEYVAIGILFLLVLGGGITMLVMANTRNSAPSMAKDDEAEAGAPFAGRDATPLGDTAQHAGQQDEEGRTVSPNDAQERGGTGAQTSGPRSAGHSGAQDTEEPDGGRFQRDPVGGEGEGTPAAPVGEVPHPRRDRSA